VTLGAQLRRLGRHSAVYGIGGIVSRILAVLLLPLYTRFLTTEDLGAVGLLVALNAVLVTVLRLGITSAFFRFYFDASDDAGRRLVVQTSFWFTMAMATIGLVAGLLLAWPIADLLSLQGQEELVAAAFVGLWAQMNYEQQTSLFRVEERSTAYVLASLANIAITVGATVLLVVALEQGALGVIVGNWIGTLTVYSALLAVHRGQLGLAFSRPLLREMNQFGIPLVPAALALIAIHFADRFFLEELVGLHEVGLYEIGSRIASGMVLLITAFRLAWPAFAYSIADDAEAKRTYAFVLTYFVALASWLALGLGLLSPWLVRLLATEPFYEGSRVVGLLAFGSVGYAAYIVMAIGVGRAKRTQFNWVITGVAATLSVGLNLVLVPTYGMIGSAVSQVAAYTTMFALMSWYAQRVYPTRYQWRRVLTAAATGAALLGIGKAFHVGLALALALAAVYPLVLGTLGFYLPAERRRLRAVLTRGGSAAVGS
jgi:O-antigen/teichoic acid export membrane protein